MIIQTCKVVAQNTLFHKLFVFNAGFIIVRDGNSVVMIHKFFKLFTSSIMCNVAPCCTVKFSRITTAFELTAFVV